MHFSNEPLDIMDIIQLFIPVITFAMGYFLTDIEHRRDRKRDIVREKFDKLYHPFYRLINELGTDSEYGFAFNTEDVAGLRPFFDHLAMNIHLATTEGQTLFWETRKLFLCTLAKANLPETDLEEKFAQSISALFSHLIQEYIKSAVILGYNLGGAEAVMGMTDAGEVKTDQAV